MRPLLEKFQNAFAPVAIYALNLFIVSPLFSGEYTYRYESIEGAFIAHSKHIVANWPNLNWNALWYGGFPFHYVYTPILPYLLALLNFLWPGISIARWYRIVTALTFALGPVTLYFLVKYLFKRQLIAVAAAFIYSVAPSISYFIPEVNSIAAYFRSAPWRLIVLTVYGEGPHVFGLALIPLAVISFMEALRRPRLRNYGAASFAIAAVALVNLVAMYALAMILAVVWLSEAILGDATRKLKSALLCAVSSYGLSAFQYDASFISALLASGRVQPENKIRLPEVPSVLLIIIIIVSIFVFMSIVRFFYGKPRFQFTFLCLLWFSIFFTLPLGWYYYRLNLAPQSFRYIPELDMMSAILFAALFTLAHDKLLNRRFESSGKAMSVYLRRKMFRSSLIVIFLILLLGASISFILTTLPSGYQFRVGSPLADSDPLDMNQTPEKVIAIWLASHVKDERVYATGSISFWLNVFSDVGQLRGGADQAGTNPWWADLTYQINKGSDGSLAVLWLKAFNIRYVVVDYPNATTPYKDYLYPRKFEGLLPERYSYEFFKIFEVPLANSRLVQVVNSTAAANLKPIQDIFDDSNLLPYLAMIEQPADVARSEYWIESADKIIINVQHSTRECAVLVKMTYDERWRAYLDGKEMQVRPVGPSFMLINIGNVEGQRLELTCQRTASEVVGISLTGIAIIFLSVLSLHRRMSKARRSRSNVDAYDEISRENLSK